MASETTPVANWTATSYINKDDYNNFVKYIYAISQDLREFYPDIGSTFDWWDGTYAPYVGYGDFPTADKWNLIEDAIETLDKFTNHIVSVGDKKVFIAGDKYIDYIELNRLTNALIGFYNLYDDLYRNRISLPFTLGDYRGIKV